MTTFKSSALFTLLLALAVYSVSAARPGVAQQADDRRKVETAGLPTATSRSSDARVRTIPHSTVWLAPIGHRQPRATDIPASTSLGLRNFALEDAIVDRKINGICRGC